MAGEDDGFIGLFLRLAAEDGTRPFARREGAAAPITFGELDRRSAAMAAGLRRDGVRRGDRVAVMLRNGPLPLALIFALARAGVAWVPVNVALRGDGLRHVLNHSEPRLVVAEPELLAVIRASGATLSGVPLLTAPPEDAGEFDEPAPGPEDLFAIMYTSGTTGPAKGVLVTHRMMRLAGEGALLAAAPRDGEVMLLWEPLYHIGGAQLIMLPLRRRVTLAMLERFSAGRFWAAVKAAGATHIHYLGGILQMLLKQPPGPLDRTHGARIAWGGGCPPEIWRPFEERFGVQLRECYGMTEASSFTSFNDRGVVGSIGWPVPWFTVTLLDEDGRPVPPGARGEIVVQSADPRALTRGYFRDPEATARALRGRVLYTGDLGSRDDAGNLFFHGRLTESVRVRGENVSAWEVEHVAAAHPAVEECAMIGVAAEVGEQEIKLFIKPRAGVALDPAALGAWLAERLAPYQTPRYIALVEGFERTPSQRIMKHRLSPDRDGCWDRMADDGRR